MASSSPASTSPWKYVVFLSFRGKDTRKTFTTHLYQSLKKRGISTFQDDEKLEYGDSISKELMKGIEDSKAALIIFSKSYATSRWCLNELVKIIECKEKNGQIVIPIFYNVDPSHVRNQTESYAEAFAKHESSYKDDVKGMQKVQEWRNSLTVAANLKGFDIRGGIEFDSIQKIVDHISKLCKSAYFLYSSQDIVGLDIHLENMESIVDKEIDDAQIVGIWGMGGIGKTTIATTIFHKYNPSGQFEAACILDDVKENAAKNGLCSLQNILLCELLGGKDNYVASKQVGKCMIPSRLCSMKVLIVLDDIDHIDHLEYLAGDVGWFGKGSIVIVTTRNRDLLKINDDAIYEMKLLPDDEAMQLFNKHAFKKEVPDESFKKLSLEVVNHAKGLPLALKMWGGSLHKKGLSRWEIIVGEIKKTSNLGIVEKLKISYDGLDPNEKKIFLDMACFFRGNDKEEVMQILESCDFSAEYGLSVLIDKSLVFISDYNRIEMHDLIQDMGRYVVKMQKDSGGLSRIWNAKDFEEVMLNNTGSMAVEAIWFPYLAQLNFNKEVMKNMTRLRILRICYKHAYKEDSNCPIEYFSNNLCWFDWEDYPWNSFPQSFNPQKLVHLSLSQSSLHHLWNKTKVHLPCLRMLDLSYSKRLTETPNFAEMPNLQYLSLFRCMSLEEVHPSLGCCRKLKRLNLSGSKSLVRFPYVNVESLEYLDLVSCRSLETFPEILGTRKPELEILTEGSGIRKLPSSFFQHQAHLTELDLNKYLGYPQNIVSLPSSICMLKDLVKLDVSGCTKLESFPVEIGDLENLEQLYAMRTLISQPPSSIVRLNKLKVLDFSKVNYSKDFESLEYYSENFVFPQLNGGLRSLEILNLSGCNLIDGGLPEDIGCLSSLKHLNLTGNNFEHLLQGITQLGTLQSLRLSCCKRLKELPRSMRMPNLEELDLSFCNLIDGGFLEDIGCLSSLKHLNLTGNNFEHLPQSIAQLGDLQSLNLSYCKRLKELPRFMSMPNLEKLDLSFCNLIDGRLLEDIGCLSSLKELNLRGHNFEHLPRSISQHGALQSLNLSDCKRLKELPGFPVQLDTISADWRNDWMCNSLFQNISSLQHDFSASDSFSLRVFRSLFLGNKRIPTWFHHRGSGTSISINLAENWYISDNFLGFAVCYYNYGNLTDITAHLIPLCDDGMSSMTQKLALSNHVGFGIHFSLVPLSCLWDASKANGKTPNDYGCIRFSFSGVIVEFGCRLLYKVEPAKHCIGIKRSRDEDSEHHEPSCSSSQKH